MARKRTGAILIPDEPLDAQVLFAIRALAHRIAERASEWLAPYGLTSTKFTYLAALYARRDRGLTLNELSELVHTTNASVTSMVDALERDGLAERSAHPTDRRSMVVKPSPKGRTLFEQAFVVHHRNIERCLASFDRAERRMLLDLLVRLGEAFSGRDGDGPDRAAV